LEFLRITFIDENGDGTGVARSESSPHSTLGHLKLSAVLAMTAIDAANETLGRPPAVPTECVPRWFAKKRRTSPAHCLPFER